MDVNTYEQGKSLWDKKKKKPLLLHAILFTTLILLN